MLGLVTKGTLFDLFTTVNTLFRLGPSMLSA